MIIGNVATYPARGQIGINTITQLSRQVDILNVTLNEYESIPTTLARYKNINPVIPDKDYKDVGKFIFERPSDDDYVFLFDDDIIYPSKYTTDMIEMLDALPFKKAVAGLHGVIYSDFFDGLQRSRCVLPFNRENPNFRLVNQLGTGTVVCRGSELPQKEYMEGSELFVDVRFAAHQKSSNTPMICLPRPKEWLKEAIEEDTNSIFSTFTKTWPNDVVREVLEFGGYSNLDPVASQTILDWERELVS